MGGGHFGGKATRRIIFSSLVWEEESELLLHSPNCTSRSIIGVAVAHALGSIHLQNSKWILFFWRKVKKMQRRILSNGEAFNNQFLLRHLHACKKSSLVGTILMCSFHRAIENLIYMMYDLLLQAAQHIWRERRGQIGQRRSICCLLKLLQQERNWADNPHCALEDDTQAFSQSVGQVPRRQRTASQVLHQLEPKVGQRSAIQSSSCFFKTSTLRCPPAQPFFLSSPSLLHLACIWGVRNWWQASERAAALLHTEDSNHFWGSTLQQESNNQHQYDQFGAF